MLGARVPTRTHLVHPHPVERADEHEGRRTDLEHQRRHAQPSDRAAQVRAVECLAAGLECYLIPFLVVHEAQHGAHEPHSEGGHIEEVGCRGRWMVDG